MQPKTEKMKVAILGTGNIGTDLLMKVLRSPWLECRLFAGRNLSSPGMMKADQLGVPVSGKSIQSIVERRAEFDLVFDATSAEDHQRHAKILADLGLLAVDLTPAKVGKMCVPAVNLDSYFSSRNPPTLIKMDIEGSERPALDGARRLLGEHCPKLAVSAYHHPRDLWEIPLRITQLNPGYRLFLRHYTREIDDTVKLCVAAG